jgi:hypothetical protein
MLPVAVKLGVYELGFSIGAQGKIEARINGIAPIIAVFINGNKTTL